MQSLLDGWVANLKRFWGDERGAIAMMYGPMMIVLLLFAGVAIDYSRAYLIKREISRALDAAVLAAGSLALTDEDAMREVAERYFTANLSSRTIADYNPQLVLSIENDDVKVTSEANVPTTLMRLAHIDDVDVRARSVIGRTLVNVEVALVLDNTGSMDDNNKMEDLQAAAKQLIATLYEPEGSSNFVRFAIVPFTGAVNVGSANKDAAWMDGDGFSVAAQDDYSSTQTYWGISAYTGMTAYEALDFWSVDWKGCVRARVGMGADDNGDPIDLDLSDVEPDAGNVDTLFAPFVKPLHGHSNWWGGQPSSSSIISRLEFDHSCPDIPILPLTNDEDNLGDTIDSMVPNGGTSVPVGLAWGWRVLSSKVPFTQGRDYGEDNVQKVIVLLTDGENDLGNYTNSQTGGYYNAYGMPNYGHLGTGGALANALNDKLEVLCSNVKTRGILIYAITFQVDDVFTQDLMRGCATRSDMYYNSPDGATLQDAFDQIASGLQKLQLKK